ncbi:oligosaccharide flippase family protein [Rhodococcus sp. GG48]|nr:oligosaccharide flippase family protein [Rhodococcus sp. GG48]
MDLGGLVLLRRREALSRSDFGGGSLDLASAIRKTQGFTMTDDLAERENVRKDSEERSSFYQGAAWLSIATMAVRVSPLLLLWLVLQDGDPAGFGEYSLANSIVGIATLVAESGIILATTTHPGITEDDESAIAAQALTRGVVYYLLCLLAGASISLRPGFDSIVLYTAILAIPVPLAGVAAVAIGRKQRAGQFRKIASAQISAAALGVVAGAIAYLFGLGMTALVAQTVISMVLFYCLVMATGGRLRIKRNSELVAQFRRTLGFALGGNLVSTLGRRADDIFIGLILGPFALGQYSVGYRILTTGTQTMLHTGERVATSQLGAAYAHSANRAWGVVVRNQRRIAFSAGPAFAAAAVGGYFLIPQALGPEWTTAATCSFYLCLAGTIQSTYNLTYMAVFRLLDPRSAFTYQCVSVSLILLPTLAGTVAGVEGASIGYLAGSCAGALVAHMWSRRVRMAMGDRAGTPTITNVGD